MALDEFDPVVALNAAEPGDPGPRPDIVALLGPHFDRPRGEPAPKTLILCAAPRTGSYELARLLTAAGIGVAHEYFNPTCAAALAARWGLPGDVLEEAALGGYIDELRRRRWAGDVFATKLQYWQFKDTLRNAHGRALFEPAVVVHLFRADILAQFVSLHRARETGRFDFTDELTHFPSGEAEPYAIEVLRRMLDELVAEDANFRRLFALGGMRPIFCEYAELGRDPHGVVARIAAALAVPVDQDRLAATVAHGARYGRADDRVQRQAALLAVLRPDAFRK